MLLTDIRSLDHTDVITTIPNTAHPFLGVLANEPCDVSLLSWGASACYNRR